jgi:hypothetical protein
MTQLSPRLIPVFDRTKTICFGRFLVDVPESADIIWGRAIVPLEVVVYPGGAAQVKTMAQQFINELSGEKAINKNYVPRLISVEEVTQPQGKLVTGYADFEAIDEYKINGYFELDGNGITIGARPLGEQKNETVRLINSIARRLRHRGENEIPAEAGNCIQRAFLPDVPNPKEEDLLEHISIGVRLKEIPDAHFSIYIAPANPHNPDGDSLENQFKRTFADMTGPEDKKVLTNTKIFRQGVRQIHEWKTGFEILMRAPDEDGSLSHHDFRMRFVGVPHDMFKPYADVQFQTGVGDNAAGQIKASLTDEEALAAWDKITSTIRVRPTSAAPVRAAETGIGSRRPLGELAATGRVCPQSGVWESSDSSARIEDGNRRHIHAGERMPHVISPGEPSIWQKLKGERPSYQTATVWKLVAYDDSSGGNNIADQASGSVSSGGPELGDNPTQPNNKG